MTAPALAFSNLARPRRRRSTLTREEAYRRGIRNGTICPCARCCQSDPFRARFLRLAQRDIRNRFKTLRPEKDL